MNPMRPSTISFRNVGETVLMKWLANIPDVRKSTWLVERLSSYEYGGRSK